MKKKATKPPNATQDRMEQRRSNMKKSPKAKQKPPAAKPLPGRPLAWESKSHRLEINPPVVQASRSIHIDDLSTTEDDEERNTTTRYKKSIDKLLNDVSVNGQEYIKAKTSEQLNASRRLLADQEEEIKVYKDDLDATARNCDSLRRSVEVLNKEVEVTKTEAEILGNEKDDLEKKLLTIELEGREASKELYELRDSCRRLKLDKRLTTADVDTLTNQRELLLNKLEEFELKNRKLRKLVKEERKVNEAEQIAADRCEILLQKLTDAEARIQSQSIQLVDQDKQIDSLIAQVDADKHQVKTYDDLHKTMETTRGHLQNQLRQKEGESNRLESRIRNMEESCNAASIKANHYQGLLTSTRDKSVKDKEALKKATRIQRDRAQKQEELNTELQAQLSDLLFQLENIKKSSGELNAENCKLLQEKDGLEDDYKVLRKHVFDVSNVIELSPKYVNARTNQVTDKILSEIKKMKFVSVENANLKDEFRVTEDKLISLEKSIADKMNKKETELSQLRAALSEYEGLTSEYKNQVDRLHSENEHLHEKIGKQEKEMHKQLQASVFEVGEVRTTLQSKIAELEPYADQLKSTEIRLNDAQGRADNAEKHYTEHKMLVSELTQKVELLSEKLEHVQEKYRNKLNENNLVSTQIKTMERKMDESDASHRELLLSISRKEEMIRSIQIKFEDQTVENERLVQQLEIALSNAKKESDAQKEKSFAKERSAQARILDLETQLSRSTQNTELLKQSKDEAEKKFGSRLQDMRDRLEQANSTTRSMQNYVHFLKSTYANVFSDDVESDHRM